MPSQLANPALQAMTPHTLLAHPETAFARLHLVPHAPQLLGSVERLTQDPLQFVSPVWQLTVHLPLEHTSPAGQTLPHVPQFDGSTSVAVHVVPHSVWLAGHWHAPETHAWPGWQTIEQPPQCAGSLLSFTHPMPAQRV